MGSPRHRPGTWIDVIGSIDQAAGAASLTQEALRDTAILMYWMRRDQNDAFTLRFQMPHGWDYSTYVNPHLHLLAAGDADGTIAFDGYYHWSSIGSSLTVSALSGWTTYTKSRVTTAAEQWREVAVSLGPITPPAGVADSAHLWVYVRRVAATDTYEGNKTGGGTAAANVGLISFDCHCRVNAPGSDAEFPGA